MYKLEVAEEIHVALFDAVRTFTSQFVFRIAPPEVKPSDPNAQRQQPQEERPMQFLFDCFVEEPFTMKCSSPYFDPVETTAPVQYGEMPFSLQTFLELYRDPRSHRFEFRTKPSCTLSIAELSQQPSVATLTIKTRFQQNPFRLPVRAQTEADKHIYIITELAEGEAASDEFVICSGKLVEQTEMEEYKGFVFEKEDNHPPLLMYHYEVPWTTAHKHICIYRGQFEHRRMRIADIDILILSVRPHPVEHIPALREALSRIATSMQLRTTVIIQNCPTVIEECDGVVFYSRSCNLYERLFRSYLYSKIKDEWIIQGIVGFRNNSRDLHVKWHELCELVAKGEQFSAIADSEYCMDEVWRLKAVVVYYIIANLTRQGDKLTSMLLSSIKEGRRMNLDTFIRAIKNKFGLVNMKTYVNQFIKGTGVPRLYHEFCHVKKENRITIQIRQKPLQSATFQFYNWARAKLEEAYHCRSPLTDRMLDKNIRSDEQHTPSVALKKKEMLLGPLLVPLRLHSGAFFKGKLPVVIAETNEQEYREEQYDFQLKKKKITKESVNCRVKLRKTINKKGISEKEGSRLPSWMKLDSAHTFLFMAKNENMDELKLQRQLVRERNELEMLRVVQLVKQYPKDSLLVSQICTMIDIKEGNTTTLEIREQILSVIPAILAGSEDKKPWDVLQGLLRLYEPPCYDRSIEGHRFKLALCDCLAKLKFRKGYHAYFEEFHRILLQMSKEADNPFSLAEEVEFRKALYRAILNWRTKYTIDVLTEIEEICKVYLPNVDDYRDVLRLLIERTTLYLDHLDLDPEEFPQLQRLDKLFKLLVEADRTHRLWLCGWTREITNAEKEQSILDFIMYISRQLEEIRVTRPSIYQEALRTVKDLLLKNKKKYALEMQTTSLNLNQNYLVAQVLWEKMTTGESLVNAGVRLYWMKIYRVLYFYFTPICVAAKLREMRERRQNMELRPPTFVPYELPLSTHELNEVSSLLKDFVPDLDWMVGYDAYHKKSDTLRAQDKEQNERSRHKKKIPRVELNLGNNQIMARFVKANPDKEINWVELSKRALDIIIGKHENKRTRNEIINALKAVKKKLKRGNMPRGYSFEELQSQTIRILEEGEQETETIRDLFEQSNRILEKVVRQQDTKFILPADIIRSGDSAMTGNTGSSNAFNRRENSVESTEPMVKMQ